MESTSEVLGYILEAIEITEKSNMKMGSIFDPHLKDKF